MALEAVLRGSEVERRMTDVADSAGSIEALPLWTSRWTALPGFTHTIKIDEPRYVHMFNALLARGGPAHFGQLKLPKGASFGGDYMLRSSEAAPKVGVLMEALTAEVLPDGSIAIVARVLGRFRIATPTAAAPYACADVALLPDEEELSEARGMQQPTDIPAHWRMEAARAAAATASLTWWEAEAGRTSAAAAVAEATAATAAAKDAAAAAAAAAPVAGTEEAAAAEEEDGRGAATNAAASILAQGLANEERRGTEVPAPFNLGLSIAGCASSARSAAERAAEASLATEP
jgi:Lon protease-like protein